MALNLGSKAYSIYRYLLVVVVSGAIFRYLYRLSVSTQAGQLISRIDVGYSSLVQLMKDNAKMSLPPFQLNQLLQSYGVSQVSQLDQGLKIGLLCLGGFALLSLLGFRKHLVLYFFFFFALMVVDFPAHYDDTEKFFEIHVDHILLMGLSGYASTL